MAYTTITKILESGLSKQEFINLLNDEGRDANFIILDPEDPEYDENDPLIKRAEGKINKADGLIDSFLRGRFPLPLNHVPIIIEELSNDLSIYYMFEHRHRMSMPEDLVIKFKDNMKLLAQIQKGDVNPGIDEAVKKEDVIIRTDKNSGSKTFTDDFMKDF